MVHTLSLHDAEVKAQHDVALKAVAFQPGGDLVATADVRRQVRVWRHGEVLFQEDLRVRLDRFRALDLVRMLAFSPDGGTLYVAAGETIRAFDAETGSERWVYYAPPTFAFLITSPLSISVSSEGRIAAAFDSGCIAIFAPDGRRERIWYGNDSPRVISYLPDQQRLVGSDGFSVGVWDSASGVKLMRFVPEGRLYGIAASPRGDVVSLRTLHEAIVFDLNQGQEISRIPVNPGLPVMALSPAADLLALVDRDGVELVSFDGTRVARMDQPESTVITACFTPDGSRLAAGCSDGTLRVWTIPTGPTR